MTEEEDGIAYFSKLAKDSEKKTEQSKELTESILEAIRELNESKNKGEEKKVVKFAGEKIEYIKSLTFIVIV